MSKALNHKSARHQRNTTHLKHLTPVNHRMENRLLKKRLASIFANNHRHHQPHGHTNNDNSNSFNLKNVMKHALRRRNSSTLLLPFADSAPNESKKQSSTQDIQLTFDFAHLEPPTPTSKKAYRDRQKVKRRAELQRIRDQVKRMDFTMTDQSWQQLSKDLTDSLVDEELRYELLVTYAKERVWKDKSIKSTSRSDDTFRKAFTLYHEPSASNYLKNQRALEMLSDIPALSVITLADCFKKHVTRFARAVHPTVEKSVFTKLPSSWLKCIPWIKTIHLNFLEISSSLVVQWLETMYSGDIETAMKEDYFVDSSNSPKIKKLLLEAEFYIAPTAVAEHTSLGSIAGGQCDEVDMKNQHHCGGKLAAEISTVEDVKLMNSKALEDGDDRKDNDHVGGGVTEAIADGDVNTDGVKTYGSNGHDENSLDERISANSVKITNRDKARLMLAQIFLKQHLPCLNQTFGFPLIRWVEEQSSKMLTKIGGWVHQEVWKSINEDISYSSTIVDLFTDLEYLGEFFIDYLATMKPFAVDQTPYFMNAVNAMVLNYCRLAVKSCGDLSALIPNKYERQRKAITVSPHFFAFHCSKVVFVLAFYTPTSFPA